MKPDLKILNETLAALSCDVSLSASRIDLSSEFYPLERASDALNSFAEGSVDGWLMVSSEKQIFRLQGDSVAAARDSFPLWGECVAAVGDRTVSRSIQIADRGWVVTTAARLEARNGEFIRTVSRLGHGGLPSLRYEVAFELLPVGIHQEWRTSAARFIGFEEKKGGDHGAV